MNDNLSSNSLPREDSLECAICLQPCMQPVQLPCSHVFCFLCAKGTAMQSRKCALCRSDIPSEFITKPSLFTKQCNSNNTPVSNARHVWYYQGYRGWWQYDDRTCSEIESAYDQKLKSVDVLVAGAVYIIDFENMLQYQRNGNSRRRKIKRDLESVQKKGVAGLEISKTMSASSSSDTSADVATSSVGALRSEASASNQKSSATPEGSTPDMSPIQPDIMRQIPVGSEELLHINQPAGGDAHPLDVQAPALTRSLTDYTQNSQLNPVVNLNRCNTYTPTRTYNIDEPME